MYGILVQYIFLNLVGMMNLKKQAFSKEELREALKKFKATRDDVQDEKVR